MTTALRPAARSTGAASTSYFGLSRAHRYSILFALPLLVGYETLAAVLAKPGKAELRNGADAMLRSLFVTVAGVHGSAIFMAFICLVGVALVVRDLRATRAGIRPIVFAGMLAESAAL